MQTQGNTIQYNTIQYNTMQYNTIRYNTIQIKIQYNTTQYNTIQYNTIQYNTIQLQFGLQQFLQQRWGGLSLCDNLWSMGNRSSYPDVLLTSGASSLRRRQRPARLTTVLRIKESLAAWFLNWHDPWTGTWILLWPNFKTRCVGNATNTKPAITYYRSRIRPRFLW